MKALINLTFVGALLGATLVATAAISNVGDELPMAERHHATVEMQERFADLF